MTGHGIIYFDGVCGLCNRFVDFVLTRDREHRFRFAPLQGTTAAARFSPLGGAAPETILYEEGDRLYARSTAALRILSRLGGLWWIVSALRICPAVIRDAVYDWIARNRYGWFGRREACRIPTAEERAVFLD